jgi:hypothetical protein
MTAKMYYLGFEFHKESGCSNEEWINPKTQNTFKIKQTSDYLSEEEVLSIINQAGITLEEFNRV